jgi:DNA uptake protein ComE-like DNA-binding protein
MKTWQALLLGFLLSLLVTGLIVLVINHPHGNPTILHTAPTSTSSPLVIYVTGAVNLPDVYELPAGSRVKDAIASAGGLLPEADISQLNLAALLQDADRIWVPTKEVRVVNADISTSEAVPAKSQSLATPSTAHPVNINTANQVNWRCFRESDPQEH